MNKKHLSVVMAGAMLASSVAPVLAETTKVEEHDVLTGNIGLLYKDAEALFASKVYSKNDVKAGQTVYGFRAKGVKNNTKEAGWWYGDTKQHSEFMVGTPEEVSADFLASLKVMNNEIEADRQDSYEIEFVELGNRTNKLDEIVSTEGTKYKKERFEEILNFFVNSSSNVNTRIAVLKDAGVIEDMKYDDTKGKETLTITLANNDGNTRKEIVLTTDDFELDFSKPVDKDGKVLNVDNIGKDKTIKPSEVVGFKEDTTTTNPIKEEKVLYKVNLLPGSERRELKLDDLYDGLMLTTEGHALLRELNEDEASVDGKNVFVKAPADKADGSLNEFTVTVKNKDGKTTKVITIKGNNTTRLKVVAKWLNAGHAQVDILAGEDRYATAVEIAKTFVADQYAPNKVGSTKELEDIVMINGTALVDGLAAAPFAHAKNAPILLTAEGHLPKVTKDYLRELVANNKVGKLPTIHIVGGEAVVSESIVTELEDLGFKVRRISGDDREETSLAVADKVKELNGNNKEVFVVGAKGEADAMSIASYAAASKTPIVVSASHKNGLSVVGLNEVADFKKATIIGGDAVVPQTTEDKLVKLMDKDAVSRVKGSDRKATNAEVIKRYHKNYSEVLVSNEKTLVDALPVSVFASRESNSNGTTTNAAPIVLASTSLTTEQINQVYANTNKFGNNQDVNRNSNTLYQVGHNVERSVMETLADRLGLLH